MAPPHIPAVPPADAITSVNSCTSVNDPTHLTLSSAPPVPDLVTTSYYIGSQTTPTEPIPPIPISIPSTLWQSVLNGSVEEELLDATLYIMDTHALLQQFTAAAGSENTADLGIL